MGLRKGITFRSHAPVNMTRNIQKSITQDERASRNFDGAHRVQSARNRFGFVRIGALYSKWRIELTKIKIIPATIILSVTVALPALAQDARNKHLRRVNDELSEPFQTSARSQASVRIENASLSERDSSRVGGADADFHPPSN